MKIRIDTNKRPITDDTFRTDSSMYSVNSKVRPRKDSNDSLDTDKDKDEDELRGTIVQDES